MHETDLHLTAEIKLYYDLYVPENSTKPAPLLVAVHGYGAHKRYMMREARLVAPDDFAVVALQAPHQHFRPTGDGYKIGFGWLTDYKAEESVRVHQDFVTRIVEKLAGENAIDERRVYLFGFSQACALNFRFALTHPEKTRGIVGISGGIPSDLETNADYRKLNRAALYLYGDDDEFYPLEKFETCAERLKAFAPALETKRYAARHVITDEMRRDVREWLHGQNRER